VTQDLSITGWGKLSLPMRNWTSGLPASRWRPCEIRGIQASAFGAVQPAALETETYPTRIRLSEADYTGPRHAVTVRRIPPAWRTGSDEDWYEWEERPGPEPVSHATGPDDELVIQVRYVEGKPRG
jgi:hypothetical protein